MSGWDRQALDFRRARRIFAQGMNPLILLAVLVIAGSVAGFFSGRLPMSGKAALGLSILPAVGFGLTPLFC